MTITCVPKPKGTKPEVWAVIVDAYTLRGYRTVADMATALSLAKNEGDILQNDIPPSYTLRRYIERLAKFYASEPVGLRDIPPEHSAFVLKVLLAVLEETEGRLAQFSRAEVDWICRVHAATTPATPGKPEISPWQAYKYAVEYWTQEQAGESSVSLDLLLAFRPWEGDEEGRFDRALFGRWLPEGNYPHHYPGRIIVEANSAAVTREGELDATQE